jgi:rare lipoprotein A
MKFSISTNVFTGLALICLILGSCQNRRTAVETESKMIEVKGTASFYAKRLQGRKTANGEIYDPTKLTAAHRTLPFDTMVEVTNLQNGKTVQVRINDRGPFRKSRIIDLSRAAAERLEMIDKGVAQVIIQYPRDP